jgi:hypothetical protein
MSKTIEGQQILAQLTSLEEKPTDWEFKFYKAEHRLAQILNIVRCYLPNDEKLNIEEAMSAIIGLVDPWPLPTPAPMYTVPRAALHKSLPMQVTPCVKT